MARSLLIAASMLLALSSQANALTCKQVRDAVASNGEAFVISWALRNGYTEAQIIRIKRVCHVGRA